MKRGQKGGTEGAIPVILLIILAVFIGAKFGLIPVQGIPILENLVGGATTKVAVVGHLSPEMNEILSSEQIAVIKKVTTVPDISPDDVGRGFSLKNYDVVILQGRRDCSFAAREKLADFVNGGGKLIVIGDACTTVREDPTVYGWKIGVHTLGDVMPVEIGKLSRNFAEGRLRVYNWDHPIFNGLTGAQQRGYVDFSGDIVKVTPTKGEVLAAVDTGDSTQVYYGIIESKGLGLGKVIYFAFDPAKSTQSYSLVYNTLLYITSRKG
ncbi:MAG: hypothetical protein ACP5IG_01085 [Candidatus Micrarchaeia archaeon]